MIVEDVDFRELIESVMTLFDTHLPKEGFSLLRDKTREHLEFLATANLRCYQANMIVIAERKKNQADCSLISDMELQARVVGEQRVKSKATINALLSALYPAEGRSSESETGRWMSDDIVYSVGEMLDRLTIETIKRTDYAARIAESGEDPDQLRKKTDQSSDWSDRVMRYLNYKLEEIARKGFYESTAETRTYDLQGIHTPHFFKNADKD
jgi:hypothetical protein